MSSKPELPSVFQLREEVNAHRIVWAGRSSPMMDMLRAYHAAIKEPWCGKCKGSGTEYMVDNAYMGNRIASYGGSWQDCPSCNGTGLNPNARAVLEMGEAAGLGGEKEETT